MNLEDISDLHKTSTQLIKCVIHRKLNTWKQRMNSGYQDQERRENGTDGQ